MNPSRVVIGAGLFGCYAALVLAERGHDVLLLDQAPEPLSRASYVNQARLHTGLHYPRSLLTATEALRSYRRFRDEFGPAVRDFNQIYAVAARNSRVSGDDFAAFIPRLGLEAEEVDADRWFLPGTVQRAFRVEEPSFDAAVLRDMLVARLREYPNVTVRLGAAVVEAQRRDEGIRLTLGDGTVVETPEVVLAVYAGTNALRQMLDMDPLPIAFELAEVVLGRVGQRLSGMGFTVMDGPFWSLMPFGHTDEVTLTSVGLTPVRRNDGDARFECQSNRADCTPGHLADCTSCPFRPPSTAVHQQRQMAAFLKDADDFSPVRSLMTVKAILRTTEIDDARPTIVLREPGVCSVFSGKVSTLFDLDRGLA